jgi:hypothetical protein
MLSLNQQYGSSSDDEEQSSAERSEQASLPKRVTSAPALSGSGSAVALLAAQDARGRELACLNGTAVTSGAVMLHNPRAEVMWAPFQGPAHPNTGSAAPTGLTRNTLTGYVERAAVNDVSFDERLKEQIAMTGQGSSVLRRKRRRGAPGDSADISGGYRGPWATFEEDLPDDIEDSELPEGKMPIVLPAPPPKEKEPLERSIFHGKESTRGKGMQRASVRFDSFLGLVIYCSPEGWTTTSSCGMSTMIGSVCVLLWDTKTRFATCASATTGTDS